MSALRDTVVRNGAVAADTVGQPHGPLSVGPAMQSADSLPTTDTVVVRDTLWMATDADSLVVAPVDTAAAGGWRRAQVEEVLGDSSYVPPVGNRSQGATPAVYDAVYQLMAVLLLLAYLLVVCRYGRQVWRMMRSVWERWHDGGHSGDGEMPAAKIQALVIGFGLLMTGMATVRLFVMWQNMYDVPAWLAVVCVMAAALAVMGIQRLVLWAVGALTFSRTAVSWLCGRRMSLLASWCVAGGPAVILMALSSGVASRVSAAVFAVVTILHGVVYAIRSSDWFAEQKVSILLWILYLCIVEVMPAGIMIIGLLRNWPA